jgi:hypothetical protein
LYIRRDAVEDETNTRFIPALAAVEAAPLDNSKPMFILTMDPLVIQMVAGTNTRIVDLESVDIKMLDGLIASKATLLFLKQNDRFMEADLKRYGEPILRVLSLPSQPLDGGDGFTVSLIKPTENQPESGSK